MRQDCSDMTTDGPTRGSHSADVRITLTVDGRVFSVAQLGPNFLSVRKPIAYPPTDAEVMLSIDGHARKWRVFLFEGIPADGRDGQFRSYPGTEETVE
jgi:hypothetical protein